MSPFRIPRYAEVCCHVFRFGEPNLEGLDANGLDRRNDAFSLAFSSSCRFMLFHQQRSAHSVTPAYQSRLADAFPLHEADNNVIISENDEFSNHQDWFWTMFLPTEIPLKGEPPVLKTLTQTPPPGTVKTVLGGSSPSNKGWSSWGQKPRFLTTFAHGSKRKETSRGPQGLLF